jgi:hypothetical protein
MKAIVPTAAAGRSRLGERRRAGSPARARASVEACGVPGPGARIRVAKEASRFGGGDDSGCTEASVRQLGQAAGRLLS